VFVARGPALSLSGFSIRDQGRVWRSENEIKVKCLPHIIILSPRNDRFMTQAVIGVQSPPKVAGRMVF
jgi:hypothetical protein